MTTEKFGRKYRITVYPVQILRNKVFSPIVGKETIQIELPFTVKMNINRNILASSNKGTFSIYNLKETKRNDLFRDFYDPLAHRRITVQAGYDEPLPIVFDGNMEFCVSVRDSGETNFITEIQAYDWSFPLINAYTNTNFSGQVPKQRVVDQIIKDITDFGPEGQKVKRGYVHQYDDSEKVSNGVFSGWSWDLLKRETENSCFIDNGEIHVVYEGEHYGNTVHEVSSDTGLLGAPKRSETYVVAETVFDPTIRVGSLVRLNSRSQKIFNGEYKVLGVQHFGTISGAVSGKMQTNITLSNPQKTKELMYTESTV